MANQVEEDLRFEFTRLTDRLADVTRALEIIDDEINPDMDEYNDLIDKLYEHDLTKTKK